MSDRVAPVSVIIPAYNREDLIARAIESVLAQTVQPLEILIPDDASTDRSVEVASRYPVTVLTTDRNAGSSAARNRAIAVARGTYYACLDSDDWWAPEHLEIMMDLFARFPEAIAAGGGVRLMGARPGGERDAPARLPAGRPLDAFRQSFVATPLPHQTLVCRLDCLRRAGGYSQKNWWAEDFDMYLRLSRLGPFVASPRVTAFYWAHAGMMSGVKPAVLRDMYHARVEALDWLATQGKEGLRRELTAELLRLWDRDMGNAWYDRDRARATELLAWEDRYALRGRARRGMWRMIWAAYPILVRRDGSSRIPGWLRKRTASALGAATGQDSLVSALAPTDGATGAR